MFAGRYFDGSPRDERRLTQRSDQHSTDIKRIFKRLQDLHSAIGMPPGNRDGTGISVETGAGGGGGGADVHQFYIEGRPISGTVEWEYTIGGAAADVGIDYDMTAAELVTEFETHSAISSGDVTASGGPLPHVSIEVQFADSVNLTWPPTVSSDDLEEDTGDPVTPVMKLRRTSIAAEEEEEEPPP